jgi:hypothetical protein
MSRHLPACPVTHVTDRCALLDKDALCKPARIQETGMTVRQLISLLAKADPDATIMVDSKTGSLLILSCKAGMHQSFDDQPGLALTEDDKDFLRSMRIPI